MIRSNFRRFSTLFCILTCHLCSDPSVDQSELERIYTQHHTQVCDINEHLPYLRKLASECSTAVEIGIRSMVSTWGVLMGLSESASPLRGYIGIDLALPPKEKLETARVLAESQAIVFQFWQTNDMLVDIPPTDLLFIDSLHTYCHLTYELEKFSPNVMKYIALHDTSAPWGEQDDFEYHGDYSEYPSHISRKKRGLWPAVKDFLNSHKEWELHERCLNNHGFTVLKRKGS